MNKTEINECLLQELYKNHTKKKIAQMLNTSVSTVERRLRLLPIEHKSAGGQRKYEANYSYFNTIDNEEKAYWLGFLLADGCVKSNSNVFAVNLSTTDSGHLVKLKTCLESNYPIYSQPQQGNHGMSCLLVTNKQLADSLRAKGIVANKKTVFDVMPELQKHFWRGVIDGDGCIVLVYDGKRPQIQLSLVGTEETVIKFREFCLKTIYTNAKIDKNVDGKNIDSFRLHGSKALAICNVMYGNAKLFLDRKMRRYFEYKKIFTEYREKPC